MQKWEYQTLSLIIENDNRVHWIESPDGAKGVEQQLNQMGTDGWELVNVVALTNRGTTKGITYYLKRPLS